MSSILILLPVDGRRLQHILTCESLEERWLYLLRWLTEKNIGMCTQDEYQNPQQLKPQSVYCVISKGEVEDSYLLFQVLQLSDWQGEPPTPQYTAIVGNLAWMLVGQQTEDFCRGKDRSPEEVQIDLPVKDFLPLL
jgi:hypothetical protein